MGKCLTCSRMKRLMQIKIWAEEAGSAYAGPMLRMPKLGCRHENDGWFQADMSTGPPFASARWYAGLASIFFL